MHFIADYAVWALLNVDGRTVTYSCKCLCHFGLLWTVVSFAIIPHLLFYIYIAITCNCHMYMFLTRVAERGLLSSLKIGGKKPHPLIRYIHAFSLTVAF